MLSFENSKEYILHEILSSVRKRTKEYQIKGLPDKPGLAHLVKGDTSGKLRVFFPGQACLDYPAAVGRVIFFLYGL